MKIVADDKIPFLKGVLEPYAEVIYLPGKEITREVILNADALLTRTRTKCNASFLDGTTVKFIGTATIGIDHIDTQFCDSHKIFWTNAPGCNSSSVQQYVIVALLTAASGFRFSLKGKTIGIIGAGNVGAKVEKFARLMEMNVLLNDPPRAREEGEKKFVSIEKVLQESDIVTVHVPLNPQGEDCTLHLFTEEKFKKMKAGAWFINTSRGEVVETNAIKRALSSGRLGGVVLDVWENEPGIDLDLMAETFLSTPHIAGYSADGKANGTSKVVNSLSSFFDLPLKEWYPEEVPPPESPVISINGIGKTDEEIIRRVVVHTYNINEDNSNLRSSPADFEKLRGEYRTRREFPAYTVTLNGGTANVRKQLEGLGFKLI